MLAATAAIVVVMLARVPVRRAFGAQPAYALWLLAPAATLASFGPSRKNPPNLQRVVGRH